MFLSFKLDFDLCTLRLFWLLYSFEIFFIKYISENLFNFLLIFIRINKGELWKKKNQPKSPHRIFS